MIDLKPAIATIRAQLEEATAQALTYAALEARIAIERICYDRLAQAHDYIGPEEVRRWQPHHVIRLLEEDVDEHVAQTYSIEISREPVDDDVTDLSTLDYVPLGTQQGFDGRLLSKLWNGLSNTALHVRLPKAKGDPVPPYGDVRAIRDKVEAALAEIERIATGTITMTGFGPEVSFDCACGAKIKRRAALTPSGKIVHCVRPYCRESYTAETDPEGSGILFGRRTADAVCRCGEIVRVPLAPLETLEIHETLTATCTCGEESVFVWQLMRGARTAPESGAAA